MAHDYLEELASYEDPEVFKAKDRVIQFPFTAPVVEEKSEEEQARLAAKRRDQGLRLQAQAAKARLEKVLDSFLSCVSSNLQMLYSLSHRTIVFMTHPNSWLKEKRSW